MAARHAQSFGAFDCIVSVELHVNGRSASGRWALCQLQKPVCYMPRSGAGTYDAMLGGQTCMAWKDSNAG